MALKHVKQYYYTMLNQFMEAKADLEDFEQALKDGHITEDKLEAVKEDTALMEENLGRLQYIMYLWELPGDDKKEPSFKKANQKLFKALEEKGVLEANVVDENKSVLDHLRQELKKLKEDKQ